MVNILQFFSGFAKDCPNGQLLKEKVTEVYERIMPDGNPKFFVDQIFRIFDQDENGYIDFTVRLGSSDKSCIFLIDKPAGIHDCHRHDHQRLTRGETKMGFSDL